MTEIVAEHAAVTSTNAFNGYKQVSKAKLCGS